MLALLLPACAGVLGLPLWLPMSPACCCGRQGMGLLCSCAAVLPLRVNTVPSQLLLCRLQHHCHQQLFPHLTLLPALLPCRSSDGGCYCISRCLPDLPGAPGPQGRAVRVHDSTSGYVIKAAHCRQGGPAAEMVMVYYEDSQVCVCWGMCWGGAAGGAWRSGGRGWSRLQQQQPCWTSARVCGICDSASAVLSDAHALALHCCSPAPRPPPRRCAPASSTWPYARACGP